MLLTLIFGQVGIVEFIHCDLLLLENPFLFVYSFCSEVSPGMAHSFTAHKNNNLK